MEEKIKRKNVDIFGIMIAGLTILILGTVLFWFMSFAMAYQSEYHANEMEILNLEKEIALINNQNDTIFIKDYKCEYRLANQTINHIIELRALEKYYEGSLN